MLAFLITLPVWNFLLPVYSFWHFDHFWGETLEVKGEAQRAGPGADATAANMAKIPTRWWEDWERIRL